MQDTKLCYGLINNFTDLKEENSSDLGLWSQKAQVAIKSLSTIRQSLPFHRIYKVNNMSVFTLRRSQIYECAFLFGGS